MNKLKNLLIVDDELFIREIIQECLAERFTHVIHANEGYSALQATLLHKPDVIICDYNMPNMNGIEFVKCLRESNIQTPVIWLTGRATKIIRTQTWALGVYDFFEKPLNPDDLQRCVDGLMAFDCSTEEHTDVRKTIKKMNFEELSILLDRSDYKKLSEICSEKNIAVNTEIRKIILEYMKQYA